jgi:hypothetical protein
MDARRSQGCKYLLLLVDILANMSDVGFVVAACSDRLKCYPISRPVRICNVDFTRILSVLSPHPSAKCADVTTRIAQGDQNGDMLYLVGDVQSAKFSDVQAIRFK